MAKKKKSIELILADAEKFFQRGNFPLAQREFETVQKTLQRDDIAEKLKICERENRALRAKELIKKGSRAASKNDLKSALINFKEALTLQDEPEEWLQEKIKSLQNEHLADSADADASKAEADGRFADAASLYAVAAEKMGNQNLLLKSASCLVMAGDYAGAVQCFSSIYEYKEDDKNKGDDKDESKRVDAHKGVDKYKKYGERSTYDYGFALAKTGCCLKALDIWKYLSDKNGVFLQQKRDVFTLALSEIYEKLLKIIKNIAKLSNSETSNLSNSETLSKPHICDQSLNHLLSFELFSEIQNLSAQAGELYALSFDLGEDSQQQLLEKICNYLKYELIDMAWNREDYNSVYNTLEQIKIDGNEQVKIGTDPVILSLKAKTAFHVSINNPAALKTMVDYWFTAIYSMETAVKLSPDTVKREKIQQKLIKMAESVINSHINTPEGTSSIIQFKLEKNLIADLVKIARKLETKGSSYTEFICTPGYAALSGISDKILKIIASNRDLFDNTAHYLETGGYYCDAWKSLYLLKTGDLDKAFAHLKTLSQDNIDDQFSMYVKQLVCYEYGKAAIERGQKDFLKYFDETHLLFKSNPVLEKQLMEFIHEVSDKDNYMELLHKYDQVMSLLYQHNPSEQMAKIFSFVMIHSAIARANKGILQPIAMKHIAQNAIKLDPNNGYAQEVIEAVEIKESLEEMGLAISRRKFVKAAKIVNASPHNQIKNYYFEALSHHIDHCEQDYYDEPEFVLVLMQEMYESASMVDSDHYITKDMKRLISMWMRKR
ncbi:MAG: hypothetical protein HQK67_00010 [Desulfamplus sp.]|nr:hypothetical protein [Desulfamplus sp.]